MPLHAARAFRPVGRYMYPAIIAEIPKSTIFLGRGSCPHRLLDSTTPSPGETRKLLLALGMTRRPHIIIMDEPTNHMDLPSIECLEQALADCPCCLLLVSHDRRFLEKLTQQHWQITRKTHSDETFTIKV